MSKPIVLLIDDEVAYAKVIQAALEPHGIRVLIANNATDALTIYQQVKPNMVLLDVMMPEIDGLTLLRWLREHSDKSELPIHIVSAKSTQADRQAALEAGANGFLAKPFTFEELRAHILGHLRLAPDQTLEQPPLNSAN